MSYSAARTLNGIRVKRHRDRRKQGQMVVPVLVDTAVLDFLERCHLLPPDTEDPRRIAESIAQYFRFILENYDEPR
jgi:hypothetical protein